MIHNPFRERHFEPQISPVNTEEEAIKNIAAEQVRAKLEENLSARQLEVLIGKKVEGKSSPQLDFELELAEGRSNQIYKKAKRHAQNITSLRIIKEDLLD
jgi:hypothetical protein